MAWTFAGFDGSETENLKKETLNEQYIIVSSPLTRFSGYSHFEGILIPDVSFSQAMLFLLVGYVVKNPTLSCAHYVYPSETSA